MEELLKKYTMRSIVISTLLILLAIVKYYYDYFRSDGSSRWHLAYCFLL